MPIFQFYFRFGGLADMAGCAVGPPRSRMTHLGHRGRSFVVMHNAIRKGPAADPRTLFFANR
jgi:hypothetical protein